MIPFQSARIKLLIFFLLAASVLCMATVIILLKIHACNACLYSSDLYSFDTFLQETLKGNFGLEYTYANAFGDHAYITLLLLLPFKMLLGPNMVQALVAITPLFFALSGIILFYLLWKQSAGWISFLLSGLCYVFLLDVVQGNYEGMYGFHIDTASGFLLLITAALMSIGKEARPGKVLRIWQGISFSLFLLTKEEMALLGAVFMLILFLATRKRTYLIWTLVACMVFIGEITVIHYARTPFNRGNELILSGFLQSLGQGGLESIITRAPLSKFWNYLILYTLLFAAFCIRRPVRPVALALFITAWVKALFSYSVHDFTFYSWHSFPALVMFTGAVLIQSAAPSGVPKFSLVSTALSGLFLTISVLSFPHELTYIRSIRGCINTQKAYILLIEKELDQAKKHIDKRRVLALNHYLARYFTDGYRYSFYPRGVGMSPAGIADYVLVDRPDQKASPVVKSLVVYPDDILTNEFQPVYESEHLVLLERKRFDTVRARRGKFLMHTGEGTLGPHPYGE